MFEEIRQFWNPRTGYDIRGASHAKLAETPLQWPIAPEAASDRNPIRYPNNGVSQSPRVEGGGRRPKIAFVTERGKAFFLARPPMAPAEMPDAEFPFVLNTGRLQHQWHTLTKTGKVATLNKLNPGPFVELHPDDARALSVADKDRIEIRSRRGRAVLPAVVTDRVPPGNCFAPFHWNDVFGDDLAINAVTSDAVDPVSLQPEFKFSAVALTRVSGLVEAAVLDAGELASAAQAAALTVVARRSEAVVTERDVAATLECAPMLDATASAAVEAFGQLVGARTEEPQRWGPTTSRTSRVSSPDCVRMARRPEPSPCCRRPRRWTRASAII